MVWISFRLDFDGLGAVWERFGAVGNSFLMFLRRFGSGLEQFWIDFDGLGAVWERFGALGN